MGFDCRGVEKVRLKRELPTHISRNGSWAVYLECQRQPESHNFNGVQHGTMEPMEPTMVCSISSNE